jgi:vanillate O-demethylase ferredoxin subunit
MSAGTQTPVATGGVFTLELMKSGQRLQVPVDQTALQVLEAAGIAVPMSCGQGICGTCLTRVVGGVPDHRDMYLTGEEQDANDQFTPCCSRSKTEVLQLDL